jgi:hypothetical protein
MLFKTYCCDVLCGTSSSNGIFVDVVKSVDAALKYHRVSDENVYVVDYVWKNIILIVIYCQS